jgi:signal transduction histidine kinase
MISSELKTADVAIRPMVGTEPVSILRAILSASDYGVLLTGLDHRSLACNRRFGELFELNIDEVVNSDPELVRKNVYLRLQDPYRWRAQLEEIYADPQLEFEDELTLLGDVPVVLRRYTGPVTDEHGEIIGRLWTFLDITRQKRQQQMQQILYEVSTFHNPEPEPVCQYIVELISSFYHGATAFLAINQGDEQIFKHKASAPDWAKDVRSIALKDSHCQFVLGSREPVIIQDMATHPLCQDLNANWPSFSRYLGVPIFTRTEQPIGTLCFIDDRSDLLLDSEDVRFMSLLAMRVSAELERERHFQERVAEQRAVLYEQQKRLQMTQQILSAMNEGFRLVGAKDDVGSLIESLLQLLKNALGLESAALLLHHAHSNTLEGRAIARGSQVSHTVEWNLSQLPTLNMFIETLMEVPNLSVEWNLLQAKNFAQLLKSRYHGVALLQSEHQPIAVLALGVDDLAAVSEPYYKIHLEALLDQIGLLIQSHFLQNRLLQTNSELQKMQHQLVQREKLSIVGTLAASIAHDIRNIVSSLSLSLSFSESDPQAALQEVRTQLDRFAVLSHRLLSYARPRLVAQESVDITEIMQRVLSLTAAHIRIARVQVKTLFESGIPRVQADANQLEHLFVNLVLNAIHAMEPQGGTLTLKIQNAGDGVQGEVQDTGRGIPAEELASIFDPFVSTRSDGFGLGLFSCKRIVELHGGEILVQSQPGNGTTFLITFPMMKQEVSE